MVFIAVFCRNGISRFLIQCMKMINRRNGAIMKIPPIDGSIGNHVSTGIFVSETNGKCPMMAPGWNKY